MSILGIPPVETVECLQAVFPVVSIYSKFFLILYLWIISGMFTETDHGSRRWSCTRYAITPLGHANPCVWELQQIHLSYWHYKKGLGFCAYFAFSCFPFLFTFSLNPWK